MREGSYDGISVNPLEVMFIKVCIGGGENMCGARQAVLPDNPTHDTDQGVYCVTKACNSAHGAAVSPMGRRGTYPHGGVLFTV